MLAFFTPALLWAKLFIKCKRTSKSATSALTPRSKQPTTPCIYVHVPSIPLLSCSLGPAPQISGCWQRAPPGASCDDDVASSPCGGPQLPLGPPQGSSTSPAREGRRINALGTQPWFLRFGQTCPEPGQDGLAQKHATRRVYDGNDGCSLRRNDQRPAPTGSEGSADTAMSAASELRPVCISDSAVNGEDVL